LEGRRRREGFVAGGEGLGVRMGVVVVVVGSSIGLLQRAETFYQGYQGHHPGKAWIVHRGTTWRHHVMARRTEEEEER